MQYRIIIFIEFSLVSLETKTFHIKLVSGMLSEFRSTRKEKSINKDFRSRDD